MVYRIHLAWGCSGCGVLLGSCPTHPVQAWTRRAKGDKRVAKPESPMSRMYREVAARAGGPGLCHLGIAQWQSGRHPPWDSARKVAPANLQVNPKPSNVCRTYQIEGRELAWSWEAAPESFWASRRGKSNAGVPSRIDVMVLGFMSGSPSGALDITKMKNSIQECAQGRKIEGTLDNYR